ncbi:unnamed protein product [Mytilus coruscus]|uniref:EB domain-containing protein n=1 Tax=Mytilus coruscus TaxID=42192 RepID=A0A6J8A0R3_MYTCO|nr:unnamed protein product [Mytilus coruscus]
MKDVFCFVLTFIVFQIFISNVESYNLKCPSQSSWNFRAKFKCNSTLKYFCLYNNVEVKYVEGCKGPDWDRKGSRRIFSGSFTRGNCIQERFQPFYFQTNESMSDCIYAKSICNEEGQIEYTDDSSQDDRTCRCDNKQKYSFVKTPRNICFCIPTEEDCSCHIKSCSVNFTLSADYDCIQSGYMGNQKCIDNKKYESSDEKKRVQIKKNRLWLSKTSSKVRWSSSNTATVVFVLCLIPIIGKIVVAQHYCGFPHEKDIKIFKI